MSVKQIKIIKIVRIILSAIYFYFMLMSILYDEHFTLIGLIIFFCAIALGEALPKEYKAGNTFLNHKFKRLEITLEIISILILSWLLVIFL